MDMHTAFLKFILNAEKRLLKNYRQELERLETAYGSGSAKANILGNLLGVSKDHLLNLVATNDTFFNTAWYGKNNMGNTPAVAIYKFQREQISHLEFYFFLKMVSTVEAQIRVIMRKMYPAKYTNPKESFKGLSDKFLKQFRIYGKYNQAYNIARTVRNTVHNVGVHNDKSRTLSFKGKRFRFKQDRMIDFFTYTFILDVQESLMDSIVKVLNSKAFDRAEF